MRKGREQEENGKGARTGRELGRKEGGKGREQVEEKGESV